MGMFDSVTVPCPSCGTGYEAQSKSGPCALESYTLEQAPDDVMQNVNRHAPFTCDCGVSFHVEYEVTITNRRVVKEHPDAC